METPKTSPWSWLLAILAALLVFVTQCHRMETSTDQLSRTTSVIAAAADSVRYYRDHLGRTVAEKKALEADVTTLVASFAILSRNQKTLVEDVKAMPPAQQRGLVAAASIIQTVTIHDHVNVDTSHVWTLASDTLRYHIRSHGDTLHVDSLVIPNRILVTQYRDGKNTVHVTARNTNPMLKNTDVDAIVPPEKKPRGVWKWVAIVGAFIAGAAITR